MEHLPQTSTFLLTTRESPDLPTKSETEWHRAFSFGDDVNLDESEEGAPEVVRPVPPLIAPRGDLYALKKLTEAVEPLRQVVISLNRVRVIYGFGDASGKGYGYSILLPDGNVYWRSGAWPWPIVDESSSFREFRKRIDDLKGR
jgi:hypothetical protein